VKISHPDIHVKIPEDLEIFTKIKEKNWVSFDLGVKSVNEVFEFGFVVD
jgi:predicted unusual protein kinase regulating ubiquinone biosynthesis (AarF/ABC1/UbiB family)